MNVRILFLAVFLISGIFFAQAAQLKLPALVGNHMVLQQQSKISVWGWAKAGSTVAVKAEWIGNTEKTVTEKDGKWKLELQTNEAGGPYQLEISSDTTYLLTDVMIGEVWVCSGQSNMQMPFRGYTSQPVVGSNDYIAHGHNNNIRLFTVKRKLSVTPLDDCEGSWSVSNPEDVGNFSAVAYVFGKYIQEVLNVPVGLIHTSWGGTPVEAWTDAATLESGFKEFDLSILDTPDEANSKTPTVLFNGMINPVVSFTIRGAIWYQGEANRKKPEQYAKLFPAMIENWREHWNQPELPLYFAQIAPFKYDSTVNSAYLREAQLITAQTVANTGMAVTMDIGELNCIHPAEKILVGKRLAYHALAKTYGLNGLQYNGPVFREMKVEGNAASLLFDFAEVGFSSFGKPLTGFSIAGADRVFHPASARIKGKELVVSSEQVPSPVAVRYCWENFAVGSLYNTAGLPASSFRTDDWNE